ncbi:MAG: signal recognition particle receptor subunit alpha, partial [Pseudomonadota bacterium]
MFHQLTTRIMASFQGFTGNRMTEGNIKDAISDIRKALLDADVAYPVVKTLLTRVQKEAAGQLIHKQVSPHQAFIQIFYQALVDVLGKEAVPLNFHAQPPVILLLVGLQGAGKTSFAAKLAGWIQKTTGKKVGLVSTDIYRPAAMEQLTIQAGLVNAYCYPATPDKSPLSLAQAALQDAKNRGLDVLIVDTAGRLHVDDAMMIEVKGLHQYLHPTETLLVVDGMMGKDAVTSALAFHEALTLTGVLVSKLDGDARGGAVLSVKETIGAPVKFIGVGEKMDAIEIFHPERIASRILGMGGEFAASPCKMS